MKLASLLQAMDFFLNMSLKNLKAVHVFLFLVLSLAYCNQPTSNTPDIIKIDSHSSREKDGEIKTYDSEGRLQSKINYVNGLKEGIATSYYPNGNELLLIPYINGEKEGMSIKYFENGDVYAKTPYVADKIHGIRTYYYRSGNIKAEIPYFQGHVGIGLKEYDIHGQFILHNQTIRLEKEANGIKISMTVKCRKPLFFYGKLTDNLWLDKSSNEVNILPQKEKLSGFVEYQKLNGGYFICECITNQGNRLILTTRMDGSN